MTLLSKSIRVGLAAAALAATAAPVLAASPPKGAPAARNCFYSSQWRGWKAPTPNILYIGVNNRDVYRADLSAGSRQLMWSSNHLISELHGSNLICSAIDLDLKVSDGYGFATPIIVKSLVKLTPEEVAAIPKKYLP